MCLKWSEDRCTGQCPVGMHTSHNAIQGTCMVRLHESPRYCTFTVPCNAIVVLDCTCRQYVALLQFNASNAVLVSGCTSRQDIAVLQRNASNTIVVLGCSRSWQVIVIRTSDREGPLSPSAATYLCPAKGPAKKTWMCIVSPWAQESNS